MRTDTTQTSAPFKERELSAIARCVFLAAKDGEHMLAEKMVALYLQKVTCRN